MKRPTVLLFDVDGTLLLSGGAGKRAVSRAFDDLLDAPHVLDAHDFRGMTDLALFRAGIAAAGRPFSPALVARLIDRYLLHLAPELRAASSFRVLPGVAALLAELAPRHELALGLGTGNVQRGARLKLARAGLDAHFAFGGFGDDAEDRVELLRCGAARGAARLGYAPDACRVIVIGDSPRDVQASQGIGASCIGVATGGHPTAELLALGADAACETLEDPRALTALLA
jgi:phosphoglycolate phosphatase